ncbi:hypothetical protein D8M06_13935 [Oceanobacillus halophilus]|uniref:Uncharacterized protein n=1 Tax=Oceanobacillus halophilus TaxID=930130 RepID=A0A494ZXK4_9BACI|nr:hypothetical protein D8M06_13935 [Oceanobacillus halophilus]
MKLLLGQFVLIAIIWIGMLMFYSDMNEASRIIFYLVTSWMLFILVGIIKVFMRERKEKSTK